MLLLFSFLCLAMFSSLKYEKPRFRPRPLISSKKAETLSDDRCQLHFLCKACRQIAQQSRLLRGSWLPYVSSTEKYRFHNSWTEMQGALNAKCHLCTLIWRSMVKSKIYRDAASAKLDIPPLEVELVNNPFGNGDFEVGGWGVLLNVRSVGERINKDKGYGGLFILHHTSEVMNGFGTRDHPAQSFLHTWSAPHAELARYWLDQCLAKHVKCRESKPNHIPTRLLCLDSAGDTGCVRLYKTTDEDIGLGYCTLSHCWGGATDILTLTSQNITSLFNSIKIEHLPKTFRDAIEVTKALGLEYLWIDSLCIIQDSSDDWSREAAVMGTIYANATCTISAAVGGDHKRRLLHRSRSAHHFPLQTCRGSGRYGVSTLR